MDSTSFLSEQSTRMLRIAVVTETYAPEINGVAHTMRHIVETLLHLGHSVELTRPRQFHDEQYSALGAEASADAPMPQPNFDLQLVRGQSIPRYRELRLGLTRPSSLVQQWRKTRPDIVHIVTEGPLGWAALIAARRLKIPVSSGFHTNFHSYSQHYGVGLFAGIVDTMLRNLHNRCAVTMVPTTQIRQALQARGYQRLAVVGRGIDTVLFNPSRRSQTLRKAWGVDEHTPVLIYVGRLAPEKNLPLFIRAVQTVRLTSPGTRVVLVGDGPDANALRAAHPDFIFAGMRTGIDLAAHYASADLFLFPSTTETFGNVTMEALASGLAVIAYDYAAAQKHIVHDESGMLVPVGDVDAFVTCAKTLAQTPAKLKKLQQNATLVAQHLSWTCVADEFVNVLTRVISKHRLQTEVPAKKIVLEPVAQRTKRTTSELPPFPN